MHVVKCQSTPFKFQNSSIRIIGRTLSSATTSGHGGSGSDGRKGVLYISQRSSITGTSPSDCFVSYPRHSFGESYPFAEMQSVYSTVPADWVIQITINIYISRVIFREHVLLLFGDSILDQNNNLPLCNMLDTSIFANFHSLSLIGVRFHLKITWYKNLSLFYLTMLCLYIYIYIYIYINMSHQFR